MLEQRLAQRELLSESHPGKRVLVCCGDLYHAGGDVIRWFTPVAGDLGLSVDWVDGTAFPSTASLREYALVLCAKGNVVSAKDSSPWLSAEDERFLHYVSSGGCLLVVHAGLTSHGRLPSFSSMVGGHFVSHPPPCVVTLQGLSTHPLGKVFPSPLSVFDEHYVVEMDALDVAPFLVSRSEHGEQVAGWSRRVGRGRVCALSPGHFPEVWLLPECQQWLRHFLSWILKHSLCSP